MPFFGSNNAKDGGPKPRPLTSSEEEQKTPQSKKDKGSAGTEMAKDLKGTTVKLNKKTYVIEKKLAEGGFAIVYLVTDKHNRYYALKRQLIRDDPRQVEACRTESQIVKNLNGHKNIVAYQDHQLCVNKAGIYDYMLLTVYYPANVLQLLNSRLLLNKWLATREILDIFCDVCEAVARLHHSKTPVIHRDLKIENILIDQRTGSEKPVYVLCDFGSATTIVLSKEQFTHAYMEEEIQRYTTLAYRAPEMIDLYSGVQIDTKSDIWALGILLYKLCYFSLPFGESALAIQSGLFTFPESPPVREEINAMINLLLTPNARHRPNIYQTAHLAFSAAGRKCPVYNIERSPRIELDEAIRILQMRIKLGPQEYARLYEKAFNDFEAQKRRHTAPAAVAKEQLIKQPEKMARDQQDQTDSGGAKMAYGDVLPGPSCIPAEGVIVNTAVTPCRSTTTSVNPRLRPKAQPTPTPTPTTIRHQIAGGQTPTPMTTRNQEELAMTTTMTPVGVQQQQQYLDHHRAHTIGGGIMITPDLRPKLEESGGINSSKLHTSAFRPYTLVQSDHVSKIGHISSSDLPQVRTDRFESSASSSNPFFQPVELDNPQILDANPVDVADDDEDTEFGQYFDDIRRARPVQQAQTQVVLDWAAIEQNMGDDPFGNAPWKPIT